MLCLVVVVVVVVVYLHDNNKSVTGMNTILNLHHANKALTEVHNCCHETELCI